MSRAAEKKALSEQYQAEKAERRRRADAYPKLVEALRNSLRSDKFKAVAEMEARGLLRELGEVE